MDDFISYIGKLERICDFFIRLTHEDEAIQKGLKKQLTLSYTNSFYSRLISLLPLEEQRTIAAILKNDKDPSATFTKLQERLKSNIDEDIVSGIALDELEKIVKNILHIAKESLSLERKEAAFSAIEFILTAKP